MKYLTFCIIFQLLHVRAFKVEPRQDKDTSSSPAGHGSLKKSRHTDTRTRTDFLAQGEFWIYEMTWRSPNPSGLLRHRERFQISIQFARRQRESAAAFALTLCVLMVGSPF